MFQEFPLNEMEVVNSQVYHTGIDWKLLAENFMEWYHVGPVHPTLAQFSTPEQHFMNEGNGQYVGFVTRPVTNCDGPADIDKFNPTPGSTSIDQETAYFYHIFPNVSVTIYPHSVYTLVMLPFGPGRSKEILYLLQHPKSKLENDTKEQYAEKQKALFDFVCTVNAEDITICNQVSAGLRNPQYRGGRFSPDMERTCYRFQNMIADTMADMKPGLYPPDFNSYYKAFPTMR